MSERQLNHYAVFSFTDSFWQHTAEERRSFLKQLGTEIPGLADRVFLYNIFPTRSEGDVMIWSALRAEDPQAAGNFFRSFASMSVSWRQFLKPVNTLWGFTRPSVYASGKSSQELDPLQSERGSYLVVYPFLKSREWYLMSKDARQGMMNEHIRIGRQYPEIRQLLLYSTGLQDQEFVVVYETEDLAHFSQLVTALRDTEGRKYTLRDTPIYTAIYAPQEKILSGWS
ncbi:chlorite dismutase family protein [Acidobacteria bacterium AH-259-O06]|nr:chlorite dismutase family protein [Acidobacteria bacterium AH-259-L09]MDA2928771.1 chlorite dismutase family protein [Acidobacteria bacterium AH-259-O06]